jgi:hypothetical protein
MRSTQELRDKLENAAAASGLSLVQEVERRLMKTFQEEEWTAAIGGPNAEPFVRPILYYFDFLDRNFLHWNTDPMVAKIVRDAVSIIAEAVFDGPLTLDRQRRYLHEGRDKYEDWRLLTALDGAILVLSVLGLIEKPPEFAQLRAQRRSDRAAQRPTWRAAQRRLAVQRKKGH